jgi:hypothetical protein
MSIQSKIVLKFLDLRKRPINRAVKVEIKRDNTIVLNLTTAASDSTFTTPPVEGELNSVFQVRCWAADYHPVFQFTLLKPGANTPVAVQFPVKVTDEVTMVVPDYAQLPQGLQNLLHASELEPGEQQPPGSGQALYEGLEDEQKAGLLNLYAKMDKTRLAPNRMVSSALLSFYQIQPARVHAFVSPGLMDEVSRLKKIFDRVSGGAHDAPPGYKLEKSYKTKDRYGNLQLTFFHNQSTGNWLVDADVDNARGIGHVFQVIEHKLENTDSHPFDIQQILLAQGVDPGYDLTV